jgi:hypothetical protein
MALRISKLWEKHLDGGSDSPRLNHITNLFSVTYEERFRIVRKLYCSTVD